MNISIQNFLTYSLTAFTLILIPVYWHCYGLQNFLWLSDVGLFLTVIGLWLNSTLLISIAVTGVFCVEVAWCIDFFMQLFFDIPVTHLADYMFDPSYPVMLRALSLFHIITPCIWTGYMAKYGYDKRALKYTVILYWVIIVMTYLLTDPQANINWVFLPQTVLAPYISQQVWLLGLCIFFPLGIFVPTDYFCTKFFKNA